MPTQYPIEPLQCQMLSKTWHPNIKSGGRLAGRIERNSKEGFGMLGLDQIVAKIAEMLQYKTYHADLLPPFPEDETVAKWVREYAEPKGFVKKETGSSSSPTITGVAENQLELLNEITLENGKKVQLFLGDITKIPETQAVDLLVLSTFPNDYFPTASSLIGALHRIGISVHQLAQEKAADLRTNFHCWLSKPVNQHNIGKILCFEPEDRKDPASLISGIFQSIMPFAYMDEGIRTIAMPIVATGNQGYSTEYMFAKLLETTLFWLQKEVPFDEIKIIERNKEKANRINLIFEQEKQKLEQKKAALFKYDYFISYSRKNAVEARFLYDGLLQKNADLNIFLDKEEISVGQFWQNELYENLDACKHIIALLSAEYLQSKMCIEEYNIGRARYLDEDRNIIIPIYLYSCHLPTYMKAIQFLDAREGSQEMLKKICAQLQ